MFFLTFIIILNWNSRKLYMWIKIKLFSVLKVKYVFCSSKNIQSNPDLHQRLAKLWTRATRGLFWSKILSFQVNPYFHYELNSIDLSPLNTRELQSVFKKWYHIGKSCLEPDYCSLFLRSYLKQCKTFTVFVRVPYSKIDRIISVKIMQGFQMNRCGTNRMECPYITPPFFEDTCM